jgi:hypothetical protein
VGEMQAIVIHSIRGITLMFSSIELTSSGLGYHQAHTPSFRKQTKKRTKINFRLINKRGEENQLDAQ